MQIEVDVKLDTKTLGGFLVYHNYSRASGIFSVLISLGALVLMIVRWDHFMLFQKLMLGVLALLFTVIQPAMLIWRGGRRLGTKEYEIPFHYVFGENGIVISQGEKKQESKWEDVRKCVYRKNAIYVYMSAVSAFVLPKGECGDKYDALVEMTKTHVGKG